MNQNAFEDSLRRTKMAFLMAGVKIHRTKWNKFQIFLLNFCFYFNFFWLYTDVLGEFYWLIEGIQIGKSFSELTLTAPCTAICLLSTAKSIPLYINRHRILTVVNILRDIHPVDDDNENFDADTKTRDRNNTFEGENTNEEVKSTKEIERKIVNDAAMYLNITVLLIYYSFAAVVILFSLIPIMAMAYEYYQGEEVELKLPFLIKYFFDPFQKHTWPFVYLHQVWSTFIVAITVFGVDTFFYSFCTYIQMHFQILCHRYENVVSWSSQETNERLVQLIRRHQLLIYLVDEAEAIYSKSLLFNIIISSFLICLSAFNVTFLDDIGAVVAFFTFLIMSLSQIAMLCFFGDLLLRSSMKVSEAIYMSRWYDTDAGTKKSMLLIMIRARKPCKLTAANFAVLNLTAFTTILSRSWSYFALLKTMYN